MKLTAEQEAVTRTMLRAYAFQAHGKVLSTADEDRFLRLWIERCRRRGLTMQGPSSDRPKAQA